MESVKRVLLYSRCYSDCSGRLRIALNMKQIPYECIFVDISLGQNQNCPPSALPANSDAYRKINPASTIPALAIKFAGPDGDISNSITITQSVAALEYLEEMFPGGTLSLMPYKDPYLRAIIRTLVNIIAADTHPLTALRVCRRIREQFSGSEVEEAVLTKNREWDVFWIEKGLAAYEATIVGSAGKYSVGDFVTLADVCLVPALWTAVYNGVKLEKYPTVERVFAALSELGPVQRAHWRHQPDV